MAEILLVIDAWTPLERLLPAALLMASRQRAALVGIFAHDSRLRQGAALPFTHEVGSHSASCYPVTSESIDRRIQTIAERVRRQLAAAAERQQVPWMFRTCDSSILRITDETEADVVFPGWNRNLTTISAHARRVVPKTSSGTVIVVIDNGSPASPNVISAARQLMENTKPCQLIIFKLVSDTECPVKESSAPAGRSVPAGTMNEVIVLTASMEQLIRNLRQLDPFVMLIGRDQRLMENSKLIRNLAIIQCPVALLKANMTDLSAIKG